MGKVGYVGDDLEEGRITKVVHFKKPFSYLTQLAEARKHCLKKGPNKEKPVSLKKTFHEKLKRNDNDIQLVLIWGYSFMNQCKSLEIENAVLKYNLNFNLNLLCT